MLARIAFCSLVLIAAPLSAGTIFGVEFPGEITAPAQNGLVVFGYDSTAGPWRIASGGALELLAPTISLAHFVIPKVASDDGSSAAGDIPLSTALRWDIGTGWRNLEGNEGPKTLIDCSADCSVVVGYHQAGPLHNLLYPVIWNGTTRETVLDLPEIPGVFLYAGRPLGVSDDGLTVTGEWVEGTAGGDGRRFPWTYVRGVGFVPEPAGALLCLLGLAWAPRSLVQRATAIGCAA